MKSMIEELWHGQIHPQESGLCETPELKKLIEDLAHHRENLEKVLTDPQKALLEKMLDCQNEFESLYETTVFSYGFKLGAKIALEMSEE